MQSAAGPSTSRPGRCGSAEQARTTTRPSSSTATLSGCRCWRASRKLREDGTIFGLPDTASHLEIVRSPEPAVPVDRIDSLVFYLPDTAARERLVARMAAAGLEPASQHPYWQANGGVTYRDPDGREVVFVSWVYGADRT